MSASGDKTCYEYLLGLGIKISLVVIKIEEKYVNFTCWFIEMLMYDVGFIKCVLKDESCINTNMFYMI